MKYEKKHHFFIFLFFTSVQCSIAQRASSFIGFSGSLEFNKYDFSEPELNPDFEYISKPAGSVGLVFQYQTSEKLFLKSGLGLSTEKYVLNYNYYLLDPGDPLFPRQSKITISYLQIPLMFGMNMTEMGPLTFRPSFGLNIGFLINDKESTIYEDDQESKSDLLNQHLNKTLLNLNLNLGLEYYLSDNMKLVIEPFIKKGLNTTDEEIMNSGKISYGANIGIYYRL